MIKLEQAMTIAQGTLGAISSITDCGDRWFFTFAQDRGKLGSAPFFVFKDDGRCEICLPTLKNLELIGSAKSVELPQGATQ